MKTPLLIALTLLVIAGGSYAMLSARGTTSDTDNGITVATSFYPLAYAIERIVGTEGSVVNVGAGRDPHDFRPSAQDIITLQSADLVALQGAEFEPWGDDVKAQLETEGVPVVIATEPLSLHEGGHDHDHSHDEEEHADETGHDEAHHDEEPHDEADHTHEEDAGHEEESNDAHSHEAEDDHTHEDEQHDEHEEDGQDNEDEPGYEDAHDHEHGAYDPHTWLDPVLMQEMVTYLTEAVVAVDPDNAATYEANAAALQADLAALHTDYEAALASCALDEVIVSHDAYGYVADRYGFTTHAIAGLSTQDQPSATTLATLLEEAAEGIDAILLEENSVAAYGETLARETGLTTLPINPISYAIPDGADYLSLMRDNATTFATALGCNE